jgi:post-segregation antitoxin (ccd killing protein)
MAFVQASANKRPVNLTLSEGVVSQARNYTANLSATVEVLLADFVVAQQRAKATRQQQANDWCADWNAVHEAQASFADEHSTP